MRRRECPGWWEEIMNTPLRICIALALLTGFANAMGKAPRKTSKLKGRIVAYRPADRISQTPSFASNGELFLFAVDSSSSERPTLVKIDYRHVGYTDITAEMLEDAPQLMLTAKRDRSCDQSLAQFVSSTPAIREQGTETVLASGVTFFKGFDQRTLRPDLILPCYILKKGGLKLS